MSYRFRFLDPKELHAALRYDPLTGLISRKTATRRSPIGFVYRTQHYDSYIGVTVNGKTVPAHRVAWVMATGEQPIVIDHINGVKHDNRLANLRSVSIRDNNKNRPATRKALGFVDPPDTFYERAHA